jgi:hypothetical protein
MGLLRNGGFIFLGVFPGLAKVYLPPLVFSRRRQKKTGIFPFLKTKEKRFFREEAEELRRKAQETDLSESPSLVSQKGI